MRQFIRFVCGAILTFALFNCSNGIKYSTPKVDAHLLDSLIEKGKFEMANLLIDAIEKSDGLSKEDLYLLNFEKDKMERIKAEFCLTKEDALNYIKKYIPQADEAQIDKWIKDRSLEAKKIDKQVWIFKKGPHNLFLIDSSAAIAYEKIEGKDTATTERFLQGYLPKVIDSFINKTNKSSYSEPVKMRIHIKMRVMPDAAPKGEIIRMWLPYLHSTDKYRDIKLLNVFKSDNSTNENPRGDGAQDYILSPKDYNRQSLYTEMVSNGIDTLKFGYDLEFVSYNQFFPNLEESIKPYDTTSQIYKIYTSEREQHIIFTPAIKELTNSLINKDDSPYQKVKKIWSYINDTFPWAGARDYSTIPNIPMYVLKERHGDCGEVSLLFITMARYAGVPAKWQSGWMLHPGNVNLHDWAEVYYEGIGWVPVDQSFGYIGDGQSDNNLRYFYTKGLDAYRYIVNQEYGALAPLYPTKVYPHNDEVDFQMGEVEWRGGNILNGGWKCWMEVEYL